MQGRDIISETEAALRRLMPVGLSEGSRKELEAEFEELAGGGAIGFGLAAKWVAGVGFAAIVLLGLFLGVVKTQMPVDGLVGLDGAAPDVVFLEESDRVEDVSDEGLYVDAGGSAVRKLRVRLVEETRMRDEETGIVVDLTEPREETYLVPISTF